jgi:4-hydroxybutyryl-CoA dehydratase/vinylacetyl-CoA-Delta-isomerase
MALISGEEYKKRQKKIKHNVYIYGKKVENLEDNPVTKSVLDATALMFDLALDPRYEYPMVATSHLTGQKINRNLHVNRNNDDLMGRADMALLAGQKLGTCNYRCVGCDVTNALASVTWEMDRAEGTEYHERFNQFLKKAQANDWACSGALTDAKGDRSLKVGQGDPDMYLHMVEKKSDGIVVKGAKFHQSGAIAADWTLVMAGQALREGSEDYAVAFAVPNSEEGLTYITQYNPMSMEREYAKDVYELGNPLYGQRETCIMVFDNVFIPWENVFMCGEAKHAGLAVTRFAKTHRMNCGGACKVGFADIVIGAAALAAEYQGTDRAPHIMTMITDMIRDSKQAHACAIAAAVKGFEEPLGSGVWMPDDLFGNVAKLTIAPGFWEIMSYAGDIAGGFITTMPSFEDLRNPSTEAYLEKYLKVKVPAEKRMRITKVLQNWAAGLHGAGTWHGAGSVQAQMISLMRVANIAEKKKIAMEIAGIEEEKEEK